MSQPSGYTTFCVGRHLIDVPRNFIRATGAGGTFKIVGTGEEDPSIDVVVRSDPMTVDQFATAVQKRRSALKDAESPGIDVLEFDKSMNERASLFRVRRIKEAFVSEIHFLQGHSYVTATLKSYHGRFLGAEGSLTNFMSRVSELDKRNRAGQGFCLGPVSISGDFKQERANVLFQDAADIGTGIDMLVDTYSPNPEISLLRRMDSPDSLLAKFDTQHKVLRKRALSVAGMAAEEWLGSIMLGEEQNEKKLGFAMETMRPVPEKRLPRIRLSFDTAQPLDDGSVSPKVMTDEEALALWDTVVKSIRPAE